MIPLLEQVSGKRYDEARLSEMLARSARAEDDLVAVLNAARNRPSPIDAYFGGVYYIGPIFTAFRGTEDAVEYYRMLREEVEERARQKLGPVTPEGPMAARALPSRRGGPAQLDQLPRVLEDVRRRGRGGGGVDLHQGGRRLRHRASATIPTARSRPSPTTAWAATPTCRCRDAWMMLRGTCEDFEADGLLINSIKSCNSFSAGQLMMLREVERRTGRPGGFIESDLVDPRYFSAANIKNRLESYLQMIEQKRAGKTGMKLCVGIDLGSTTTKAVILGEAGDDPRPRHHQQPQQLQGRLRRGPRRGADQRALRAARRRPERAGAEATLDDACRTLELLFRRQQFLAQLGARSRT